MNTVLVDLDGVVFWWEKRFIAEMRKRYPHIKVFDFGQRTPDDQPTVNKLMKLPEVQDVLVTPGFYRHLELIEGAVEAINEMRAEGLDVAFCSAQSNRNPTCASDKFAAVAEHFGSQWADQVIVTKQKWRVGGDILIDDKLQVDGAKKASWTHIIFDQSYNRDGSSRPRMLGWKNWREPVYSVLEARAA